MTLQIDVAEEKREVKHFKIQYPASAYTFPRDAIISTVRFDDEFVHVTLTDGRVISVPLWWIPTLYNATPKQREQYEIDHSRRVVVWDPSKCELNDELRIADYLGPVRKDS